MADRSTPLLGEEVSHFQRLGFHEVADFQDVCAALLGLGALALIKRRKR
jgi:hypothetical protein